MGRSKALLGGFILVSIASPAHGGVVRGIGAALGNAGFNIAGNRNVVSGGVDLAIGRDFVGNSQDFGTWDLALLGPVTAELSTGGRVLPQLDIALTTGRGGGAAAQPLSYVLNFDTGGQSTRITGTILLDAEVSLNGFGFYDVVFNYSSQQDVTREGRFANDDNNFDFNLGPTSVSGNIFADALAAITQPLFDATGAANPFASFSASSKLRNIIELSTDSALRRLAAGEDALLSDQKIRPPGLYDGAPLGDVLSIASDSQQAISPSSPSVGRVVPEPAVIVLLLLGVPLVIRRRARNG